MNVENLLSPAVHLLGQRRVIEILAAFQVHRPTYAEALDGR